ncbi:hypothetical protein G4B88_026566, partial [Cannabis sativa]
ISHISHYYLNLTTKLNSPHSPCSPRAACSGRRRRRALLVYLQNSRSKMEFDFRLNDFPEEYDLELKSDNEVCHPFLDEFEFVMKSSDDEKDLAYGNYVPKEVSHDDLPQEESSSPPPPPLVELDQQPMKNVENSTGLDIHFDEEQIELSLQLRDSIATEMWNDYINDISSL